VHFATLREPVKSVLEPSRRVRPAACLGRGLARVVGRSRVEGVSS
jgi:hypothetical protein